MALNSARLTSEQRAKAIEELKSQLEAAEASRGSHGTADQKSWKANVVSRVSEEKASRMAVELDTKVSDCMT